jgi:predicted esterase YcpF (UPF0227 family)
MILYLHGFRSSPASFKARALGAAMAARGLAAHFVCPTLSHVPDDAIAQAEQIIAASPQPVTLIGSSLGGFYATCLAERHGLRAALINPAVVAPLALADYLGPQTNLYTGEVFEFTPQHVDQLRAMEVAGITPERYWLLAEKGDELLDWRIAAARYAGARQTILEGGDHSFSRFPEYVPQLIEFSGL